MAAVLAVSGWVAGCGEGPEAPRARRVVLVSIDTLRADRVGSYGAERAHTSTLDGLAADGVRFVTAVSPAPLTLPSHTTLLTGLDPPHHGVRHNGIFRLADDVPTLATRLRADGFATAGFVGAFVLDHRFGLARGFDHYDDRTERPSLEKGVAVAGFAERPADAVVDAALAWLETAPERFLLFVHVYDPHADYRPPPGFAAAFPGRPYDGEIAFADAQIGRLFRAVEERWPDGRTLFVATSDHGDALGEHGEPTHSHFVYESTQHVPLLMKGPGLPAGAVVEEVVALRDVAPTVLALLGEAPLEGARGRSLLPLVRGERVEPEPGYVETLSVQFDWGWSPLLGLRTERHKYIRAPRPELYDLAADPGEEHNLASREPDRVAALDALLARRLEGARPVVPNLDPDAADRARLEALGYVVGAGPATGELGVVGGADPKDEIGSVAAFGRASELLARNRPREALAVLEDLDRGGLLIDLVRSQAALLAGEPERAEHAARRVVAEHPRRPEGHRRLVEILEHQGRLAELREVLAVLEGLDPESGWPEATRGRLAERAGRPEDAADHYAAALAAPVPAPDAAWRLAALHLEAGRTQAADAVLAGLDEKTRSSVAVVERLARAERAGGRAAAALERVDAGLEGRPGDPVLLALRAELREAAGQAEAARADREAALVSLDRVIEDGPPGPGAALRVRRAVLRAALGRDDEARTDLVRALERPGGLSIEERDRARALGAALGLDGNAGEPSDGRGSAGDEQAHAGGDR